LGVRDFEESVLLVHAVHGFDGRLDHAGERGREIAAVPPRFGLMDRQLCRHIFVEDVDGGGAVGPLDLDLHVQPAGTQDGRVDQILPIGSADACSAWPPLATLTSSESRAMWLRAICLSHRDAGRPRTIRDLSGSARHRKRPGR